MLTKKFNYCLPKSLIAQKPISPRDHSRLLVLDRANFRPTMSLRGAAATKQSYRRERDCFALKARNDMQTRDDILVHDHFFNIGKYLKKGEVVVLNDTKVIPARLITNEGKEIFLLRPLYRHSELDSESEDSDSVSEHGMTNNKWLCLTGYKGQPFVRFRGSKLEGRIYCSSVARTKKILSSRPSSLTLSRDSASNNNIICFNLSGREFWKEVEKIGEVPTPPYIVRNQRGRLRTKELDSSRPEASNSKVRKLFRENKYYQTVYAQKKGSVAAPTAGFHFTQKLINKLKRKGIKFVFVTLHVGLGTFAPIREEVVEKHQMHSEWFELNKKTADILNKAKKEGRRIVAVGTTATRVLEFCAINPLPHFFRKKSALRSSADGRSEGRATRLRPNYYLKPQSGETNIFITPGYKFKFVDALITNFHLPHSTPLLLVSAFIENQCHCERQGCHCERSEAISDLSRDCRVPRQGGVLAMTNNRNDTGAKILLKAYREAIKKKYRFYSFGDAMLIF